MNILLENDLQSGAGLSTYIKLEDIKFTSPPNIPGLALRVATGDTETSLIEHKKESLCSGRQYKTPRLQKYIYVLHPLRRRKPEALLHEVDIDKILG